MLDLFASSGDDGDGSWRVHSSGLAWPTVIDTEGDLAKLLARPEQSVQAAWRCMHALSPGVARRILVWAHHKWPHMPRQVKKDHTVCWQVLACLEKHLSAEGALLAQASGCPDAPPVTALTDDQKMMLSFCADVIVASCLGSPRRATSAYHRELLELLRLNQRLDAQHPLTPRSTARLSSVAAFSVFQDLRVLALLIAGSFFHHRGRSDRAQDMWQLAAKGARGLDWAWLEYVAEGEACRQSLNQQWLKKKLEQDIRRQALLDMHASENQSHSRVQRVLLVKRYVQSNWQSRLTSALLAELVSTSIRTLEMDFRCSEGLTLHQFVLNEKMTRARQLMRHNALTLTELAHQCGYKSITGFTTAYAMVHGVTPAVDRSTYKQQAQNMHDV